MAAGGRNGDREARFVRYPLRRRDWKGRRWCSLSVGLLSLIGVLEVLDLIRRSIQQIGRILGRILGLVSILRVSYGSLE